MTNDDWLYFADLTFGIRHFLANRIFLYKFPPSGVYKVKT